MGRFEIQKMVDDLIMEYGTNVPSELCRELGIRVQETYDIDDDIASIFRVFNRITILLNKNLELNGEIKELTLGHELGHEYLGHTLENAQFIKHMDMETRQENEADFFAVYLMLHKIDFKEQQRYVNSIEFENDVEYYLNKFNELRKGRY